MEKGRDTPPQSYAELHQRQFYESTVAIVGKIVFLFLMLLALMQHGVAVALARLQGKEPPPFTFK